MTKLIKPKAAPEVAIPFFEAKLDDLVRVVKAILPAVSKDETRAHISSMCFEVTKDGVTVIGTNGHWLARWEKLDLHDDYEEGVFLVPILALKQFLAIAKDCFSVVVKVTPKQISLPPMQLVLGGGGESIIAFYKVEATYPPWRDIIPKDACYVNAMTERAIGLSAEYLADIARSFKAAGTSSFLTEFGGPLDPIRMTAPNAESLLVVLMPCRINDATVTSDHSGDEEEDAAE